MKEKKIFGVRITVAVPEAKDWCEARNIVGQILKTGSVYSLYDYQIRGNIERYEGTR